jgi:quercetin dioxygenase-like cupin family protein
VLQGKLTLVVEGDELLLGEGVLAHVPAGVRRQLVNRSSTPCIVVAVGAQVSTTDAMGKPSSIGRSR